VAIACTGARCQPKVSARMLIIQVASRQANAEVLGTEPQRVS
jgi:hypothetical protein